MARTSNIKYDWTTIIYYVLLVFMGWLSIYGASYDFEHPGILDFSQRAGKQFIWILTAFGIAGILLLIDERIYNYFSYVIYGFTILLLIATIFVAPDIKGSRSWIVIGPISFQPAEIAKMATALALAKFMNTYGFKLRSWKNMIPLLIIIFIPMILILLQNETGSALVFLSFFLMFYREGMNGIILLIGALAALFFVVVIRFSIVPISAGTGTLGIVLAMTLIILGQFIYGYFFVKNKKEALYLLGGTLLVALISYLVSLKFRVNFNSVAFFTVLASCIYWMVMELKFRHKKFLYLSLISFGFLLFSFSSDYIFEKTLEPHQQTRIKVLLNMENDPMGAGYNINQSKIAIGSGGFWGKGFLNGTQTKLKYVPEQDTDFIFCTVGEEHGFVGSTIVLILYWLFLIRLINIAERQRETFNRVYAYCVVSIFFFHIMVNIGMVLGIMPVIGIPLPFFSYGGSSLWGFTILLFILLRLDASRFEHIR